MKNTYTKTSRITLYYILSHSEYTPGIVNGIYDIINIETDKQTKICLLSDLKEYKFKKTELNKSLKELQRLNLIEIDNDIIFNIYVENHFPANKEQIKKINAFIKKYELE